MYAVASQGRQLVLWELRQLSGLHWSSRRVALEGVPPPARTDHILTVSSESSGRTNIATTITTT